MTGDADMNARGSCLCGAVTYNVSDMPTETVACHCQMCRKQSGGVALAIRVEADAIAFVDTEHIKIFASSAWAERGFCDICGSTLFFRVSAESPEKGVYYMSYGTVDDPGGITLTSEIFVDHKPDGYSFSGSLHQMTEAEVFSMFGLQSE
ncbi:MAG: GFA family protein [Pseudomonadota bacterium]